MRILILGGTRFLGRRVAESLACFGYDLTLLSRRPASAPAGVRQICLERGAGLATLQGSHFDLVLDFICYDKESLEQLASSIVPKRYVLISSTWVPRLWSGNRADELSSAPLTAPAQLPRDTVLYLRGKLRAELALSKLRQAGVNAVSLRLPIFFGDGDHTSRLDFYRLRLTDGGPLILVNGGNNHAQIAVMEDLAQAIVRWVTETEIDRFLVWEALPDEGRSVRAIIESVAAAASLSTQLVDVPLVELARDLPAYLDWEPFWRESAMQLTVANIYAAVGIAPAVFDQDLNIWGPVADHQADLRSKELSFLANRLAA